MSADTNKPPRKRRPLSLIRLEADGHISASERKLLAYLRMGVFSEEFLERALYGVQRGTLIASARDAAAIFTPMLAGRSEEALAVALISGRGELLESKILTTGTTHATVFDAAQILRFAFANELCRAVIVAHNHPSGNKIGRAHV